MSARNPAIELYRVLLMSGIVSLHTLCAAGLGFSPLAHWVIFCKDCSHKKGFNGQPYIRLAVRDTNDNNCLIEALKELK